MENTNQENNQNNKKESLFNNMVNNINEVGDKLTVFSAGNTVVRYWGLMGFAFYVTSNFVAPMFKGLFLLADWTSIAIFYGMIILITFILGQLFNALIKILIYLFK